MFLHALATAVPPARYTQAACWDIVQRSPVRQRLSKRSRLILHSILAGDHGIATRHFAVPDIENVFDLTSDQLNAAFRFAAPQLAATALTSALARAHLVPAQLDALAERFLDERVSSHVKNGSPETAATVILDPPRAGAGAKVVGQVLALKPKHIVYVACDPIALARDLKPLTEGGYELASLRAFDLFPHTHHVEAVASLIRK